MKNLLEKIYFHGWQILISELRKIKYWFNPNIKIGKLVRIGRSVNIDTRFGGKVIIGDNCNLYSYTQIIAYEGKTVIGNNSSLGYFCVIYGQGGLTIGNDVMVSTQTVFSCGSHNFGERNKQIRLQGGSKNEIIVGDDVWIGAGCKILGGVKIGNGSVIGAGSVVTKSLDPFGVYAGIPAKFIKER